MKAYFKQQGLSQEEMEQAIATFKQQKAAQQPDVGAIQQQLTQAQAVAQKAMIDSAATMTAVSLGIDAKTILTSQDGRLKPGHGAGWGKSMMRRLRQPLNKAL